MKSHACTIALGALTTLSACGGGDERVGTPTNFEPESAEYTFVTYNAGLAVGFVPAAEARTEAIGPALAELDADVICVQEVWSPEQVAAVQAATEGSFPHQYFPEPSQDDDAFCGKGQLDSLITCLDDAACTDLCVDEVDDCLFAECGAPFLLLPDDCMRCAMANVGESPDEVVARCEVDPVSYAYDGSFGIGLISRYPLIDVQQEVFASTTNRRAVVGATIEAAQGDLSVYCTHLTAVFDTIPYPRETGGWAEEQAQQLGTLNAFVNDTKVSRVVLMGDLNTGPAINGMDGEAPENWSLIADDGWTAPYLDLDDPQCTYCADNPLLAGSADDDASRIIDHVLVQGFSEVVSAERVLDSPLPDTESCGVAYDPAALSDHYGVAATVSW